MIFTDVHSSTIPFDKDKEYIDHYVALPPTEIKILTVLVRHTYSSMSTMNAFVGEFVREQFTFAKEQG